jgi:glycosyltransferase involved in cell wall biosynthesis
MADPKLFLVEGCDFEGFPAGGQLSMSRSLIKLFGDSLALVGMETGDGPVGQWRQRRIDGTSYWFFPACRRQISAARPIIPARLLFYLSLQRYQKRILSLECKYAFTQAPEALMALSPWGLESICYMFPGVENPLKISRYRLARKLCPLFDAALFRALDRVSVVLACADECAINRFVTTSRGRIRRERIVQISTCVDLKQFYPASMREAREAVGIPLSPTVFVTNGRIGRFKGWQLLVEAFARFQQKDPESLLVFVGDGEDRPLLETEVASRGLQASVRISGFRAPGEVSSYLNAADVVVVASFAEGWSVAMLEALACGKPIVTTPVSGADEMITPGKNGLIVRSRDPAEFAAAMEQALTLKDAGVTSAATVERFSLTTLGERLAHLWFPLRLAASNPQPARETNW